MLIKLKPVIQVLFFLVFVIVMVKGQIQLWMIIFIASFLLAFLWGRFFCGYICPINTLMELTDRIYKRFGIKRKSNFSWLKSPLLKYGILILFLTLMAVSNITGKKMPLLPVLIILGFFVTLFFIPELWHRYLCPLGTIMELPGKYSLYSLRIDNAKCNDCGVCQKVCPAGAVFTGRVKEDGEDGHEIKKALCLECYECLKKCPQNAILYSKS